MECERFKKLLKSWYLQVQGEALAPARMVDFMESHLGDCPTCMFDPEAKKDVEKIITLVLPQDKLKIATRPSRKTEVAVEEADSEESDDEVEDDEETATEGDEEEIDEDEPEDEEEVDSK